MNLSVEPLVGSISPEHSTYSAFGEWLTLLGEQRRCDSKFPGEGLTLAQGVSFLFFVYQGCHCRCGQASGLLVLPGGGGGNWLVLREGSCPQEDLPIAICVHTNLCPEAQVQAVQNPRKISKLAEVWIHRF